MPAPHCYRLPGVHCPESVQRPEVVTPPTINGRRVRPVYTRPASNSHRKRERMEPRVNVSDDVLDRFRRVTSATVYSAVWRHPVDSGEWFASANWQRCLMKNVLPMTQGEMLVGRARTLRFVPPRPDLLEITRRGEHSPEYVAMGTCGPGDVLVVEAHAAEPEANIVGNMKARQLWHNGAEGIVTDGGIRDLDMIASDYGLKVFAGHRSPAGNLPWIEAYEANGAINCGGAQWTIRRRVFLS